MDGNAKHLPLGSASRLGDSVQRLRISFSSLHMHVCVCRDMQNCAVTGAAESAAGGHGRSHRDARPGARALEATTVCVSELSGSTGRAESKLKQRGPCVPKDGLCTALFVFSLRTRSSPATLPVFRNTAPVTLLRCRLPHPPAERGSVFLLGPLGSRGQP